MSARKRPGGDRPRAAWTLASVRSGATRLAIAALSLLACARRPERAPPAALAGRAGETRGAPRAAPDAGVAPPAAPRSLVDSAALTQCSLSYTCRLSHPGLGSYSRSLEVDTATCARHSPSDGRSRGPDELAQGHGRDAAAARHSPPLAPLSPAACATLRRLLLEVTDEDVARATEPAHRDSESCVLRLECAPDTGRPRLAVQRQTFAGPSRVEQIIRALYAR